MSLGNLIDMLYQEKVLIFFLHKTSWLVAHGKGPHCLCTKKRHRSACVSMKSDLISLPFSNIQSMNLGSFK